MSINTQGEFENFYRRTFDKLFAYIRYRVIDTAASEDIAAEAYIATWQNWDRLSADEKYARNFLWRVAGNKLADYLRLKYRIPLVAIDAEFVDVTDSEIDGTNSNRVSNILQELINKLPAKDKRIIELRYKEDKKISEIALELSETASNIKVRIHRIVNKMKKSWQER